MSRMLTAIAILATALGAGSIAAAGPTAARQRVTIVAKGDVDHFVLAPVTTGAVARDSGTVTWCCWSELVRTRDGQTVEINDPLATFTGRNGTFDIRFRIGWLDAGRGYTVGTSTWKVVRGTGAYKGMSGSGRGAQVWVPPDQAVSFRADGYLRRG